MSHLIFDKRDWKFILHEQLNIAQLAEWEAFSDYDVDIFDQVVEEGIKFAVERIAPVNEPGDREGAKMVDGKAITPECYKDVYKEHVQAGWLGLTHSPEYGGQGLPLSVAAPVGEATSGAGMAFAMYGGLTHAAGHLIEAFAEDKYKKLFVEKMYSGEWGGTMCLTEPHAGSEVGDARTKAVKQDDGTYHITGSKIWISGGDSDLVDNIVHMVLARVEGDPHGTKGISLFIVPKYWVNDDGSMGEPNNVSLVGVEHKMGINGSATCALNFGDEGPCRGYLVGEQRAGIMYMFQMMNEARVACGQQGVSQANAAYQQALKFARERVQGVDVTNPKAGYTEIINHPDVRRNLMLMKAYSEGTRALLAQASFWADGALHAPTEEERAAAQDQLDLVTPIAKAYATDKAFRVCELAMQVYGGSGFLKDYPVEQYLRDTKITSIYEGTNGIQALDLLGRKMRQKGGALFMTYIQNVNAFIAENKGKSEVTDELLTSLEKAQASLGEVAFWLQQTGGKNLQQALLNATPFLEIFGDVMVGHQLVQQAVIAVAKLDELAGTTQPSVEQRKDNDEIRFYAGKVDTARFFAGEFLNGVRGKVKVVTAGNTAALDMVF